MFSNMFASSCADASSAPRLFSTSCWLGRWLWCRMIFWLSRSGDLRGRLWSLLSSIMSPMRRKSCAAPAIPEESMTEFFIARLRNSISEETRSSARLRRSVSFLTDWSLACCCCRSRMSSIMRMFLSLLSEATSSLMPYCPTSIASPRLWMSSSSSPFFMSSSVGELPSLCFLRSTFTLSWFPAGGAWWAVWEDVRVLGGAFLRWISDSRCRWPRINWSFSNCWRSGLTFRKPYVLSWRTKLEKLLCLKFFGSRSRANSIGFHTVKLLPSSDQETISSVAGSLTIS
mmetsp:Transcript_3248/g.7639  ORF Transcript_3248/g.7639 Transcript_3248/m.7639 type:complete len:286 (+) Transcript_3248:1260-2117(+)